MTSHRSGPARSEIARRAILDAAAETLSERGYTRLTIEGVALRAEVGKQTIYRWWGSKGALIAECLLEGLILPDRLGVADSGDIHTDLVDWLTSIIDALNPPHGEGPLLALASAAADSPEIGVRLRETILQSTGLGARLRTAAGAAPHLYPGAPIDEIVEALVGALVLRVIGRAPLSRPDAERLVVAMIGPR